MNEKGLIEALIFVSEKPISLEKLSQISGIEKEKIRKIVDELIEFYSKREGGIELVELPSGFEFRIKSEFKEFASKIAPLKELTPGMMKTLGIVIAEGPVKQSTIVRYQGNKAYGYIKALEEKGLVKTEKFGRTKIVKPSNFIEKYFGMSLEEIKKEIEKKIKES